MKKLYFIASLFFVCIAVNAQSTFIKQLSATGITNVLATDDGGYIVTTNYNVLKYSSSDSLLWNETVTDSVKMMFRQAIVLHDGGYAFLCKSGISHTDAEVVKLDQNRNVVWQKKLYGDDPRYIAEDWSGNLLIAAANNGEIDHAVLIKLDKNGNGIWLRKLSLPYTESFIGSIKISSDKKYVTSGADNGGSAVVIFDSAGNQILTKTFEQYSFYNTQAELFKNGNILFLPDTKDGLARMDNSGNIIWKKTLTAAGTDIYLESAGLFGNLILLGGYKTSTDFSDSTLIFAAANASGKFLWVKQIVTPGPASATSIAQLKDGSFIIAAAGAPYSQYNHGTSFLIKINSSGNTCGSSKIGFTESEASFPYREAKAYTSDNVNFQTPKITLKTTYTAPSTFLCSNASLQMINIAGIQKVDSKSLILSVSPNPAKTNITLFIQTVQASKANVVISDLTGKIILMKEVLLSKGDNHQELNVSTLYPGNYTILLNTSYNSASTKIMKY